MRHEVKYCGRIFLSFHFYMAKVVITNFVPIFSNLKILSGIRAPIVAALAMIFKSVLSTGKCFFPKKCCKPHLNQPTKCWRYLPLNNTTASPAPISGYHDLQTFKKWKTSHFALSCRRASFDFHQILHNDRGGPCHHFTTQTFLAPINSLATRGHRKFG